MALASGISRIKTGPVTLHTQTAIHFAEQLAKVSIPSDLYYDWLWLWLIFIMANLESNFNKQKTSVVTVIAVILLLWQILSSLSNEADSSYSAWPLWVAIYY